MLNIQKKPALKNKKVMMLWSEKLHADASKFAKDNDISISELSRLAIEAVLYPNSKKGS